MSLETFHPIIASWFCDRFSSPTDVQERSWPAIASRKDVLIAAPTGSGKTLAAFLTCIDRLFKQALRGALEDLTRIVYVSPLKALSNDVQKNLQQPLAEIAARALDAGFLMPPIRVVVRTGDTPMRERQLMLKRPPHILITTPESLYLLLTAERSRNILRDVETVIVDEIHAVAPNKRGAHLALSLERLDALAGQRPVRIGLSATQRPIDTVARFLAGNRSQPVIVDIGHRRQMDLAVEVPKDELGGVATNSIWSDIYDRLAELVHEHRSTLVFVNTRRLVERVSHHLEERLKQTLGPMAVAAHHGSLSRQIRLAAEQRLKSGQTRVVVATASLELGIDVGTVDLVCQIGSPRAIAVGLQRIGRSGHWVGAMPKGRLFATTRDELIECAALVHAIRTAGLDSIAIPETPLDILAQQIVAAAATREWREDELFDTIRQAHPYRNLERKDFDAVVRMLADGVSSRRGRRSAFLHYDGINHRIRARRGARLAAITSGGAIPDTANYAVVAEPDGTVVGSVDEDFAVESLAGDIILLGNTSWRIRGVETGRVRVEDAHGAPPTIPFWNGEAPSRTTELSAEVAKIRKTVVEISAGAAIQWLQLKSGLDRRGAEQVVAYIGEGQAVLGTVPTQDTIVAERFFDEGGGMQLVLHAPFGGRINRAWGLALRKRFCVSFDFELQAAATDDGLVLSLGERHSFPLESIFRFLHVNTLRQTLTQAVLQAPMFASRWRWNATRSLALLRFANGKRVPPQIQRMRAEDLLASVFPGATGCPDNHQGDTAYLEPPDHPLVNETIRDCLTEAMDIDGLSAILQRIDSGAIRCVAIDTPAPSVFCHEILNANPYAYLDDAPLEERRARAVEMRRTLPPELAGQLGALDPDAIAEVAAEAWPVVRDPDELHDALLTLIWLPASEIPEAWRQCMETLLQESRAVVSAFYGSGYVAAERTSNVTILDIVRGWMESTGPTTADQLATRLQLHSDEVQAALLQLESEGQVLRGKFRGTPANESSEWCDRRLLARIHRLTVGRLRKAIEPVTAADFMRFLCQWQHLTPGARLHGEEGLREIIDQLGGFEAPAGAWEKHIFPMRMSKYDPDFLDRLCLGGSVMWSRLSASSAERPSLTSVAPISLFPREAADWLLRQTSRQPDLGPIAESVYGYLRDRGASFSSDISRATNQSQADIEEGLWQLTAAGLLTADGFENLRILLNRGRRRELPNRKHGARHAAGRWSLLPDRRDGASQQAEPLARQLLKRYGIVFRDLVKRESLDVAWRDLLVQYRRMELRGEIRGGRFVTGFVGEQFALPEAVESVRAARRSSPEAATAEVRISAADPLNLVGIILPGPRVSSTSTNFIALRNGMVANLAADADTDVALGAAGSRVI
jgi:ATP-dependent Lhr-like helicase